METDFGDWEGKDYNTISKEFPKYTQLFLSNHNKFVFPNGESYKDFYKRCKKAIKYIIKKSEPNYTILIVSHAGVIRCIISYLIGFGRKGFYFTNPKQGAYSSINVYDNNVELEFINRM